MQNWGPILGVKFETLDSNLGQLQFEQEAKLPLLSVSHQSQTIYY